MLRDSRLQVWLLTLLCVTLLFGRVGGTHFHLCFDGKEPPISLHLFDTGLHHGPTDMVVPHQDTDVAASGDMLSKLKFGLELPLALLAAVFLLGLFARMRQFVASPVPLAVLAAPLFLLPPLRGPPLLTSP